LRTGKLEGFTPEFALLASRNFLVKAGAVDDYYACIA
jgi:hypothetical protein